MTLGEEFGLGSLYWLVKNVHLRRMDGLVAGLTISVEFAGWRTVLARFEMSAVKMMALLRAVFSAVFPAFLKGLAVNASGESSCDYPAGLTCDCAVTGPFCASLKGWRPAAGRTEGGWLAVLM